MSPKTSRKSISAKLIQKVPMVTADTDRLPVHTLTFSTPTDLNVRIDFGDVVKVIVPDYKPKSFSMSAQRDGEFDITCKVYPNGRASGYLDRLKIGESMQVFGKGKKKRSAGKKVGLIAFGVGITEAMPIAVAELEKPDAESVVLLWQSKTMGDTFWHDKAAAMKTKYGDRFELVIVLSRDKNPSASHYGRVTPSLLNTVFAQRWNESKTTTAIADTTTTTTTPTPTTTTTTTITTTRTTPTNSTTTTNTTTTNNNNNNNTTTTNNNDTAASRSTTRFLTVGTKEMMKAADVMLTEVGYVGGGYKGQHALLRK